MPDYGPLLLPYRKAAGERATLKIGIAFDGASAQAWVRELIEYLSGVPGFEVTALPLHGGNRTPADPPWLVDRLYAHSRTGFDPFREAPLGAFIQEIPRRRFDMLVWLAPHTAAPDSLEPLARFGVFTFQLGEPRTEPPYWRELIEAAPIAETVVWWHRATLARGRPLRIAETAVREDWTFTNNARDPLAAAMRMVAEIGLEMLSDPGWWVRALAIDETDRPCQPRRYPSTWDAARFALRQARRSVRVRLQARSGRVPRWFTAVRRDPSVFYTRTGRFSTDGLEDIPLAGTYMADPFVATHGARTWLFFEDIPTGSTRGRLSAMPVGDAPGSFGPAEPVLETGKHLSFPCVFDHRGEYFMLPEASEDRVIQLYRAVRFPNEFRLEATLVEDIGLVDTVPFFLDGYWYFFTSTSLLEPFSETYLFWSDRLDGRWNLHPASPISSSVRNIRSAGHLFYRDGRLFRPTQDCSRRYGYGITVNEVLRLTPSEFEEQKVDWIGPFWGRGLLGTHTLNASDMIEVIDGIRYQ